MSEISNVRCNYLLGCEKEKENSLESLSSTDLNKYIDEYNWDDGFDTPTRVLNSVTAKLLQQFYVFIVPVATDILMSLMLRQLK